MRNKFEKTTKNILSLVGAVSLILGLIYTSLLIFEKVYHPQPELKYSLRMNGIKTENDNFISIKKELLGNFPEELFVVYLVITNVGDKDLKYSDFYSSDTLKVKFKDNSLYSVIENSDNKKYINLKIEKIDKGEITLKFDTIEAGDEISLRILGDYFVKNMKITAKSKYFDEVLPIDFETVELNPSDVDFETWNKLKPKDFIDYMLYVLILVIVIHIVMIVSPLKIDNKECELEGKGRGVQNPKSE